MTPSAIRVIGWPAFANREFNPYNALLYESVAREGLRVSEFNPVWAVAKGTDILHVHWPDALIDQPLRADAAARATALLAFMSLIRIRGGKIVWTVHNLASHDVFHPRIEEWFWPLFIKRLSGYIALSEHGRVTARERFPNLRAIPGFVVPHGDYRAEYPRRIEGLDARSRLGIEAGARVILFFGRIRPYKGVRELIQTFSLMEGRDLVLCIAGSPGSEEFGQSVRGAARRDDRIHPHLRFVPREEAQIFFAAADLVVLPYVEILNSGSAMLALSFDRPVLLPRRGALVELQEQVGTGWVRTFAGELTPSGLDSAIDWAVGGDRSDAAPLEPFRWEGIGRQTANVYRQVLQRG